jgi:hypothetical protein
VRLRPEVAADLERHGVEVGPGETPQALRERLNDRYLLEVRRLRERQRVGEIALPDYAREVERLKQGYPLLGLPLALWTETSG